MTNDRVRTIGDIADRLYAQRFGGNLTNRLVDLWDAYRDAAPDTRIVTEVGDLTPADLANMAHHFGWTR